jgi:Xaa-Pro dipeptidase
MYHLAGDPITGFSSSVTMDEGDMVRAWVYGPAWQGYWCDPGRTAVVDGKPSPEQRELIRAANEIVVRRIDEIRPGTRVADIVERGSTMRKATTEYDQAMKMCPQRTGSGCSGRTRTTSRAWATAARRSPRARP